MENLKKRITLWAVRALLALPLALAAGCGSSSESTSAAPPDPGYPPAPIEPPPLPTPPNSGAPSGTNGIGRVIISQGVQDLAGALPLVAGRNATVRVFLAAPEGSAPAQPTVNVALWDATGTQVLNENIPAPGPAIPTAPDLGKFNDTWNLDVPGALIQTGTTFQASIVADAQSQGLSQLTWPADGHPLPLKVALSGNVIRLTLVPVTTHPSPGGPGVTGQVTSATRVLADWTSRINQVFPVGSAPASIDLQVAPAWDPGLAYTAGQDLLEASNLRTALERMRKATVGSAFRFYAGIFVRPTGSGLLGIGDVGRPGQDFAKSLLCLDQVPPNLGYDDDSPSTLAHELGHCLGRAHAPCRAPWADPAYPYPSATLGTWGLDTATHLPKDPQLYRDLMGYCTPYWTSDYTYHAIMDAMAKDQAGLQALNARQASDAVLVSGRINADGSATLDPFLDVQDLPGEPDPGPYLLTLYDAQGTTLAAVPFGLEEATEGGPPSTFLFEVDLTPAQEAALARATVTTPGGAVTQQLPLAAARSGREPLAVPWRGGVHLGWDPGVHPEVLVRDPRTGSVIATAHGGGVDLATDAGELELLMLDGLHTQVRRVKVTP